MSSRKYWVLVFTFVFTFGMFMASNAFTKPPVPTPDKAHCLKGVDVLFGVIQGHPNHDELCGFSPLRPAEFIEHGNSEPHKPVLCDTSVVVGADAIAAMLDTIWGIPCVPYIDSDSGPGQFCNQFFVPFDSSEFVNSDEDDVEHIAIGDNGYASGNFFIKDDIDGYTFKPKINPNADCSTSNLGSIDTEFLLFPVEKVHYNYSIGNINSPLGVLNATRGSSFSVSSAGGTDADQFINLFSWTNSHKDLGGFFQYDFQTLARVVKSAYFASPVAVGAALVSSILDASVGKLPQHVLGTCTLVEPVEITEEPDDNGD